MKLYGRPGGPFATHYADTEAEAYEEEVADMVAERHMWLRVGEVAVLVGLVVAIGGFIYAMA